jgi:hypothetical protein
MWRSLWPQRSVRQASAGFARDRIAKLLALATTIGLGAAFILSSGTRFLMPGPLTSAHAAIKTCSACHTASGSSKLCWIRGLATSHALADSKACLTCHKMPATAFFPHGASGDVLIQSTNRLTKIATTTPAPLSARIGSKAFPSHDVVARGLFCSTCHQEHQGANFNLAKISNEQCRSCHVLKFDSFDRDHPQFDNGYPFNRRTRIIYDHAAHFDKHFPEIAKKEGAKRIPATCSTCHNSREDKQIMGVAPFEQTCSACHLNQIIGKERASGPKGIAFLTLPGLDLQTLKSKNVPIGEWPDGSEAELTPFMKMIISRSDKGRTLMKTLNGLNLQDLSKASDEQLKAANDLAWEIKRLFFALLSGKSSDVWVNLAVEPAKLDASLVADLTATIPRDVVMGAQQQWLPNLAREITVGPITAADRPIDREQDHGGSSAAIENETDTVDAVQAASEKTEQTEARKAPDKVKHDPPACVMRVFGQCLMSSGSENKAAAAQPDATADEAGTTKAETAADRKSSAAQLPPPMQAGLKGVGQVELADSKPTKQSDDLLFPTEAELREINARNKDAHASGRRDAPAGTPEKSDGASPDVQKGSAPIASDVDPESWAEYGGWYRQDFTIFYRPTGHKDKFVYSWLRLTGPQAPRGDKNPAAEIFDTLTSKDAQGSCTKCHSVDDVPGKGRLVNFSPPLVESKRGRFTDFIHEPHLAIAGTRGCLTCHDLGKNRPYLKTYEQGNAKIFVSNFGAVKKDLCQSCHTASAARQDCLTCHKYHVNDAITSIIDTKTPIK